MGNFGLNGGIPWLTNTEGAKSLETVNLFLLECPWLKENLDPLDSGPFVWVCELQTPKPENSLGGGGGEGA